MVVPLIGGSGVKTKVLQSFARMVPVVATADGLRGIPAVHGVHVLRGESDAELAAAVVEILRNPARGREIAAQAATLLRTHFNIEVSRKSLRKAMDSFV
jgi:glycosyltransferase involved in cell wall biosynthesis